MKKMLIMILALCLAVLPVMAETTAPDAVTSASVADYYGDGILTGDDLMNAINSYSGSYAVATVNEDGTPNVAYFVFGCVKVEDKYYISLGIAENQTRVNVLRTEEAAAMYAAAPDPASGMPYAVAGARMTLKLVTDEALLKQLVVPEYPNTLFAEIVAVRSLG